MSISKQDLQDLLIQDLPAALQALREALPEQAEKHALVLTLLGRLKDANKERMTGGLSPEEYLRRLTAIRSDAANLIADLEPADFEPPAESKTAGAPSAKQGSVLYRVPQQMSLRKATICTVRVAIEEDALFEDIVMDDNVHLRQRVEVSDMMRAELLDPEGTVFAIRALSSAEQLVRETGYTQWLFSVTPNMEGEHQLLVKVSMMEYVENLGRYIPKEVSILETVTIITENTEDTPQPAFKTTGEQFAVGPSTEPHGTTRGGGSIASPVPGSRGGLNVEGEFGTKAAAETPFPKPAPAPIQVVSPSSPAPAPVQMPLPSPAAAPQASKSQPVRRLLLPALAILALVPGFIWGFSPGYVRDFWKASWQGDADAYAAYVEKHQNNPDPTVRARVGEARYRKAEKSQNIADWRAYLAHHAGETRAQQALAQVATLERHTVDGLAQQPDAVRFEQYIRDFPDGQHWQEVKKLAEAQPPTQRTELLAHLEQTATNTLKDQPSKALAQNVLKTYPQTAASPEVRQTLATNPTIKTAARSELEVALTQTMAQQPNAQTAAALLEEFPERYAEVEQVVASQPALKQAVEVDLKRAKERVAAPNAPDTDKDGVPDSADGCPQDSTKTAPGGCGCGVPDKDTDNDGILDCRDKCPKSPGDAAHKGCPAPVREQSSQLPSSQISPKNAPSAPANTRRSGLDMVKVPGGTFTMGSDEDSEEDNPEHPVAVSTFYIGKYEVTQADWKTVMGNNPSFFNTCEQCPVENVSWNDVQTFLTKLNQQYPGRNYRLPTEAEWEYAAKGGAATSPSPYAGGHNLEKVGWGRNNSGGQSHPVGEKTPNALKIYDMSGNVLEWCQDRYGKDYYTKSPKENPTGPEDGKGRCLRGGSWYNYANQLFHPSHRSSNFPNVKNSDYGFRLVSDRGMN